MILDCPRCGDPLLAHMARCATCGGDNPALPSREADSFWSSDLGLEGGLFTTGVTGLLLGLSALLSAAPPGMRLLSGGCGVLGAVAMATFQRVHASDLSKWAKRALRLGVFALLMLFTFVQDHLK